MGFFIRKVKFGIDIITTRSNVDANFIVKNL